MGVLVLTNQPACLCLQYMFELDCCAIASLCVHEFIHLTFGECVLRFVRETADDD